MLRKIDNATNRRSRKAGSIQQGVEHFLGNVGAARRAVAAGEVLFLSHSSAHETCQQAINSNNSKLQNIGRPAVVMVLESPSAVPYGPSPGLGKASESESQGQAKQAHWDSDCASLSIVLAIGLRALLDSPGETVLPLSEPPKRTRPRRWTRRITGPRVVPSHGH